MVTISLAQHGCCITLRNDRQIDPQAYCVSWCMAVLHNLCAAGNLATYTLAQDIGRAVSVKEEPHSLGHTLYG